jgi:hypothetical protein
VSRVYVLLPPSETKHPGGHGQPLDLDRLAFPELSPTRSRLLAAVETLAGDLPSARTALKVSANLDNEIVLNTRLLTGPTMPALSRYTGVLYSALNTPKLSPAETRRAQDRVLIASALFGLVRGGDEIPAYRLSAGSKLPGLATMASLWRPAMTEVLAGLDAPVLDLRSGAYAAFAPAPGAIAVRVVTVTRAGVVKPVSHDNKAVKGILARMVCTTRAAITDVSGLLRVAYRAGLNVKRTGPLSVDLVAPPVH